MMLSEYMIVAIFYILGILISKAFDISAIVFSALLLIAVAIIRSIAKKHINLKIFLLAVVMLFGGLRYFSEIQNDLQRIFPDKYVTITGTIYSESVPAGDGSVHRYTLKAESICYDDRNLDTGEKILFYAKDELEIGTTIRASGFLDKLDEINNEHEFDYSMFFNEQGIYSSMFAQEVDIMGKEFVPSAEFISGFLASRTSKIINAHFQGNSAAFLKAILTGNKSGFSDEYISLLLETGVYRVLYAPFVHLSLIFFLANVLSRKKNLRDMLVLSALVIYAMINSSSPTILKASCVCYLFLLRKHLLGYSNKLDVLSKVLLILTVVSPLLCFNSGFFISIASSIIIYFSYSPLYSRFLKWFYKRKIKGAKFLSKALSLWLTCVFGTLPISAYFFGGISAYAIIFMVIALPVIIAILIISPFLLLSLSVFGTSFILKPIVEILVNFIAFLPEIARQFPLYYTKLRMPTITDGVIFYLIWWIFVRFAKDKLKTATTALLIVSVLGISLSSLAFIETNTLSIYFVNVGQGDGAVLHTSLGETVLIDGGGAPENNNSYNIGEKVFVPYLTSHGFTDIDVAILSHCHKDHAEGIIAAAENLEIHRIVMPPTPEDNPYHQKLLKLAKEKDIEIEYMSQGDELHFDSGLSIKFIAPNNSISEDELNDTSLIAHISYGEFDATFTGDAPDGAIEKYPENVELLKVAHHGSATSTSKEFLERTNPECAVISVGKDNSYNLPSNKVLSHLSEADVNVLRTDKMGDIQIKAKKNGKFTYKTLKGE